MLNDYIYAENGIQVVSVPERYHQYSVGKCYHQVDGPTRKKAKGDKKIFGNTTNFTTKTENLAKNALFIK